MLRNTAQNLGTALNLWNKLSKGKGCEIWDLEREEVV
jgi:hypothetical protein